MGDQHFQDNDANPGTSNAYPEHSTGPILQGKHDHDLIVELYSPKHN